ncbi:MAG: DedA family protein [Betaproteobacteria bacterium]
MQFLSDIFQIFIHLDGHLATVIANYGWFTYAILFAIIFCETGLVITPFLPGDSLLFIVGAFAANGDINIFISICTLVVAAILGDTVNYFVGSCVGDRLYQLENSRWFKKAYLLRTESFFEKYGAKTIVIARFIPIVRTYAPFVAGAARYRYKEFFMFNVLGALLWVISLVVGGYLLGGLAVVKDNLTAIIFLIILLSILPVVIELFKARVLK